MALYRKESSKETQQKDQSMIAGTCFVFSFIPESNNLHSTNRGRAAVLAVERGLGLVAQAGGRQQVYLEAFRVHRRGHRPPRPRPRQLHLHAWGKCSKHKGEVKEGQ